MSVIKKGDVSFGMMEHTVCWAMLFTQKKHAQLCLLSNELNDVQLDVLIYWNDYTAFSIQLMHLKLCSASADVETVPEFATNYIF